MAKKLGTIGGRCTEGGGEPPGFVVYLRVSTQRQGASGLGLDAQSETVERHIRSVGGVERGRVVEVESGGKSDRLGLEEAIRQCRLYRATLLIAKLDRLSRSVAFTATLMESRVDFVACDMPFATPLTIHILAAVAEHERGMISARTKAALAQAKRRGVKLGGHREGVAPPTDAARMKASVRIRRKGDEDAVRVRDTIQEIRRDGHTTLMAMAAEMNRLGVATPRGGAWSAGSVRNVLLRLQALEAKAGPGFATLSTETGAGAGWMRASRKAGAASTE